MSWKLAWKCFWMAWKNPALAKQYLRCMEGETQDNTKSSTPRESSFDFLAVLQKEGRLLDFLQENLNNFEDEQIGSAVRHIHGCCKKVLQEYCEINAILQEKEGEIVSLPEDYDRNAIQLMGNISNHPPFQGKIKHHGWKILPKKNCPSLLHGIINPAEVESK